MMLAFHIILSKILNYVIISGACAVKLPQVLKIWRARSGAGLSVLAIGLEVIAKGSKLAYSARRGFPFLTYGENSFIVLQSLTIAFMAQYFAGKFAQAFTFVLSVVLGIGVLMSSLTSIEVLAFIQAGNIFAVIVSKAIQAATNYSNGSTGQLSAVTVFLLFFGTSARVFTSMTETDDVLFISSYAVASAFNLLILCQVIYYRHSTLPHNSGPEMKYCHATPRRRTTANGASNGSYVTQKDGDSRPGVLRQKGVVHRSGITTNEPMDYARTEKSLQ